MQRPVVFVLVLASLLALAACAAEEKEAPAATSPPAAESRPAWEQEWEQILAAARREGKVVVGGPQSDENRRALTDPFQKRYGITVEYQGLGGPEFPPRLKAERDAGQYLWDIFIGGSTTVITALKPMGAVDPILPALVLPEVKDPKYWREGRFIFADKDQMNLVMTPITTLTLYVNPNLAKAEDFKSWRDFLDPRWKGKIVVARDPRVAGPGQATFQFFYMHKDLGPDFIRALARQEMGILRDDRQSLEFLAQGRYSVLMGGNIYLAAELMEKGLPIKPVDPRQMREGAYLSVGSGSVVLLNKAAHPNAARVYLNWLLSKEGQTEFSRSTTWPSWRADVPTEHVDSRTIPEPRFIATYTEEAIAARDPLVALLKEVLGD
ncbi:MAG TPA: extracellular solute-binding protein [Dehalococcoidia bacterium]|nr:extracellular solute-binding protein [Dehalococcoidia bacterium]